MLLLDATPWFCFIYMFGAAVCFSAIGPEGDEQETAKLAEEEGYISFKIQPSVTEINETEVAISDYTRCVETVLQHEDYQAQLCPLGQNGIPGIPGTHGLPGLPGYPGQKGEPGNCEECCNKKNIENEERYVPNTKQCAWNHYNFALSIGRVQSCTFNKKKSESVLRVEWHGATSIKCAQGTSCCNRWYFMFDGSECVNPQPIDGLIYLDMESSDVNIHRTMSVVGICRGISKGVRDVTFWVGGCNGEYRRGRVRTGWNSASRIIIDELPYN